LKPWPLSKIAAQKRSVCLAVHPSKLRFGKQALNAWLAAPLQVFSPSCSKKVQKAVFLNLHNISNPGSLASWHMISSRFDWRSLSSNVIT
jgi:hypothetical protein